MQVQLVKNDKNYHKANPNFNGVADSVFRFLATNQAVGANAVDLSSMVIPRTTIDLVKRGPDAGLETGRREASGTLNHSLIGVYGGIVGAVIATLMGIKKEYGTSANKILTAKETLDILAENKATQLKENTHQIDYLKETLKNLKAYNPNSVRADEEGFVKLTDNVIDDVAKILDEAISGKNMDFGKWSKKGTSNSLGVVVNKIMESTGAESNYILESTNSEKFSKTSLKTFLEDLYKVSEAFNMPKVKDAFQKQLQEGKSILDNSYIKTLTKFSKTKSIAGVMLASAIGMSIQPLNVYLTKLKTGSDGFVGVEGRQKDDSNGFKMLKLASSVGFGAMVLATLGTGLKGFMDKMAFKGFLPTVSQLKGIYGLTIISRILATRDKDELRESLTKDTLGFLSWLVLGDFVNKLTATALDNPDATVLNSTEKPTKGLWTNIKRAFNATLKTRDEILIETLADNKISTIKQVNDKTIAKTFNEMMKDLDKLPEAVQKMAKKRLGVLNKAQFAGYLFSGLVLGLGIPSLNIYITNKLDKKHKAEQAETAQQAQQAQLAEEVEEVEEVQQQDVAV